MEREDGGAANEHSMPPQGSAAELSVPSAVHVCSLKEWLESLPRRTMGIKRFLHVFSGPFNKEFGQAYYFRQKGWEVVEFDIDEHSWLDILDTKVFMAILEAVKQGHFDHVHLGVPL